MKRNARLIAVSGLVLTGALGCASSQATEQAENPSYSELREAELRSERQEFINDTQERLSTIETDINRLQARLDHEAQYVDASKRADWSQELFELKRERERLQAELNRAQTASDEEWEEMRGTLAGWVDSLQAGVAKASNEISEAVTSEQAPAQIGTSQRQNLCAMQVQQAKTDVQQEQQRVILTVTTQDQGSVKTLRQRARSLAQDMTQYPPQQLQPAAGTQGGQQQKEQPAGEAGHGSEK